VCAVLGLSTAILVAWCLAAWLPHRSLFKRFNLVSSGEGKSLAYVTVYELSRAGMVRRAWVGGAIGSNGVSLWNELGPAAALRTGLKSADQDRSWGALPMALIRGGKAAGSGVEDARGWPFLAMWCTLDPAAIEGTSGGKPSPDGLAISRVDGKITTSHFRALPMRPIWKGLAADAGVYAAAWLVALWAFAVARRWVRRRKGRCLACGYDLKRDMTGGCPECGWNRPAPEGPA
jgi:hypothetical protein